MQRPDRHYFHVTPARDLASIATRGLIPRIGLRSAAAGETQPRIYFFTSLREVESAFMNWLDEDFEEDEVLALLAVKLPFLGDASFERALACPVSPEHIYIMRDDLGEVTDLSGLRVEQRLIAYLMTADEAAQTTYFGK